MKDEVKGIWEGLKWEPSNEQFIQLTTLQNLLRDWNQKVNLTRLIEGNDFWISQIFDSLWPIRNELKHLSHKLDIIDVGTGCGFPGLALAIALPNASITLVDSIYKKTYIVKEIAKHLGLLSRVNVHTERIELTGQDINFRGRYNLAIARAVAPAPVLAEYLIPLLSQTGKALLYKGKWTEPNQQELKNALFPLKGRIERVETLQLPDGRGLRNVIHIKTTDKCPIRYPRGVGIPMKKPLSLSVR